jgi:polygalacturonase
MSGGVRNIFVYDCQFGIDFQQQYVFNAKSNSDRGGIIENIYFKDMTVGSCK